MRTFLAVLLVLAAGGLGGGVLLAGTKAFGATDTAGGFLAGSVPFLIGTVALVGVTLVLAIDEARKDQVAALARIETALGKERS